MHVCFEEKIMKVTFIKFEEEYYLFILVKIKRSCQSSTEIAENSCINCKMYKPKITTYFVLVKLKHELANLKDTKRVCIFYLPALWFCSSLLKFMWTFTDLLIKVLTRLFWFCILQIIMQETSKSVLCRNTISNCADRKGKQSTSLEGREVPKRSGWCHISKLNLLLFYFSNWFFIGKEKEFHGNSLTKLSVLELRTWEISRKSGLMLNFVPELSFLF